MKKEDDDKLERWIMDLGYSKVFIHDIQINDFPIAVQVFPKRDVESLFDLTEEELFMFFDDISAIKDTLYDVIEKNAFVIDQEMYVGRYEDIKKVHIKTPNGNNVPVCARRSEFATEEYEIVDQCCIVFTIIPRHETKERCWMQEDIQYVRQIFNGVVKFTTLFFNFG